MITWALCALLTGACGSDTSSKPESSTNASERGGSGAAPAPSKAAAASCGNGDLEGDEACDDGNQSDEDDCTHACRKPRCGDAIISPGESCDDGNQDDADACTNDCKKRGPARNARAGSPAAGMSGQGGSAGMSGQGGASAAGTGSSVPGGTPACTACRKQKCTDYQGLGDYNVVEGCLSKVDARFGASAEDPTFIEDCTAVVRCAYANKCGFKVDIADCYCGTTPFDDCFEAMGVANGPCTAEIERATRTKEREQVGLRFSDKAYPMGWAADLVACDHTLCGDVCKP